MNNTQFRMLRGEFAEMNKTLQGFEKAMNSMANAYSKANDVVKENTKITKKNKKEQRESLENVEGITKRTKILNKVIAANNGQLKFGAKTYKEYTLLGGTTFEYLSTFMKSSKEEIRLFGMEAVAVRRIMYGFLPRGMFRLVNQLATSFDAFGAVIRGVREGTSESNSLMTTFVKTARKFPSFGAVKDVFSMVGGGYFKGKQMIQTQPFDNKDTFGGLFDQSTFDKAKKGTKIKDRFAILRKEATERRKARMASIKAFFKSPKWKEVGNTMKFLGKGVVQNLAKFLFMAMLYMIIISAAIALLRKPIGRALEFMFEIVKGVMPMILQGLGFIFEGFMMVYKSLITGDILGIIEGFWYIVWGIIQVAIAALVALAFGAYAFVIGFLFGVVESVFTFIKNFFLDFKDVKKTLKRIAIVAVLVGAFIYGFPFIIGAVIITAIGVLIRKLGKIIGVFSSGGTVTTGMQLVGEKGPELVSLPRGSRVYSNNDSRNIARNSKGGVVNNYNITINAKDTSKAEMRRIADEIGRMVSSKINRRTSHRSSV